jgi:hypothetical protein
MAISNVSTNPPAASSVSAILSNATAPLVKEAVKSSVTQQISTIVALSTQGQQLSRAAAPVQAAPAPTQAAPTQTTAAPAAPAQTSQSQPSNTIGTPSSENVESRATEATESPGIQFLEGESKSGRVNTYA